MMHAMTNAEMGWAMWPMAGLVITVLGLAGAALVKYLFFR
jgi:hypothetical protein